MGLGKNILAIFFFCMALFLSYSKQSIAFDLPANFENQVIVENLKDPDYFAFSPDGRMFISERITGKLLVAKFNTTTDVWSINPTPFYTFDTPEPVRRSAGLRSITFDPDFINNGVIYAFYMKNGALQNRVVRIKASTSNADIADSNYGTGGEELLIDLPFNSTSASGSHNGGALQFGNDNKLYISTGDGWEGNFAGDPVQNLSTFTGKILRINSNGTIPSDNPFYSQALGRYRAIFALGLRNPYSMSRHPSTGLLYINEARGTGKAGIYIVESGSNYGHEDSGEGIGTNRSIWANSSIGTSGVLITGGAWYPQSGSFPSSYFGSYFTAMWGGNSEQTGKINLINSNSDTSVSVFEDNVGNVGSNTIPVKPVITQIGPDSNLYYLLTTYTTSSGAIHRVRHTVQETVVAPTILPPGGTNLSTALTVTLHTDTSNTDIRYTLDGSEPTGSSLLYSNGFSVSSNTIVKAKAFKSGLNPSSTSAANFTFNDGSVNQLPIIDAGEDKVVFVGDSTPLDGSGTTDPDGDDDLMFDEKWTQLSGPGSAVEILDASEEIAYFTPLQTGVYQFRLEMKDYLGASGIPDTVSITAIDLIADFSSTPLIGQVPLVVTFDASASTDPDDNIDIYSWDFDDGNSGMGKIINHTFNTAGSYNVILTITDTDGNMDSKSTTITVDPEPSSCVFAIGNGVSNGSFEDSLNDWIYHNNGSGTASVSNVDPQHCDYIAKLNFNAVGSNVQFYQQTVNLDASTDYTFSFTAKASTPRTIRVFLHKHTSPYNDYGLGTITANLTTEWQTFTYNFTSKGFSGSVNNGRLRFWLVTAQPGDTMFFDNIVIQKEGIEPPQPIAPSILTQPQDASAFIDQTATFSVSAQGTVPLQYQWQRDGQNIVGATSASYTTDTLVATDNGALFSVDITNSVGTVTSSTAQLTVSVIPNQTPSASFSVNNSSGIAPLTVNFDASASVDSDGTIDSYSWDFGNGETDTGIIPSYLFNTPGVYTVSLTVTDNEGESDTTTTNISVSAIGSQLPTAVFSATPLSGIAPLTVDFDATASTDPDGTIETYSWDFGEGNSGTGVTTNHTFDTQGTYNVTLTVTDNNGNTATVTTAITVNPEPGACVHAVDNGVLNGSFEENLSNWIYHNSGGGSASVSNVDPQHCDFSAKLDFTASGNNVQLYQQTVGLDANTDYTFSFTAKASTPRTIRVFLHKHTSPYNDYGLGTITANLTTEWQTFTYNFTSKGFSGSVNNGRLRFWLVTAQPGDTMFFDNIVIQKEGIEPPQPIAPSILTQPQDASAFIDQTATFSVSAQGTAPLQYQWQRDGQNIVGATSASYTTDTLVATDNGALFSVDITNSVGTVTSSTTQLTVSVTPNQTPSASFSVNNSSGIAPLTVNFDASASVDSDGTIDSYSWEFGNGETETGITPSYTFNTPGIYTVSLTVTDNEGESDTTTTNISVSAIGSQLPTAVFSATPLSGIAPLTVDFDATASTDPDGTIETYSWDFGEGNSGTGVTTNHTFDTQGTYNVTLTVTDNNGNAATMTTAITVNPEPGACVHAVDNGVLNGSFEENLSNWVYHNSGGGSASVSNVDPQHCDFSAKLDFTASGNNVQLYQQTVGLDANTDYTFSFTAKASTPRTIRVFLHKHTSPYNDYGLGTITANLTTEWQTFTYNFKSKGFTGSVFNGRLRFWLVTAQPGDTMFFDNVIIQKEGD